MILTARDADRLHRIGLELGASISAFDLNNTDQLTRFFTNLPNMVDHVLVSGGGLLPNSCADIGPPVSCP